MSAITSIFRPGPLSSKVDRQYVEAKQNPQNVTYDHPVIEEVLKSNYGLFIYQEDISTITHKLGKDISADEGQEFRKVLTKKGLGGKEVEVKERIKSKFIQGCIEKNMDEQKAQEIYKKMEYFAQYSFSKNHSYPYSMTSFHCAYLWTYYPNEWMAAYLDFESEDKKEHAITIAKSHGYKIRSLDINKSGVVWEVDMDDDLTLVQPLSSVKGLGDTAINEIMNNRPFKTVEELLFNEKVAYNKLNKRGLDALCRSGALDCLKDSRFSGGKHFWSVVAVDRPKTLKKFKENLELYRPEGDFSDEEKIENMTALTGVYPLHLVLTNEIKDKLSKKDIAPIGELADGRQAQFVWFVPRSKEVKSTKNGKPYWIISVTDSTNTLTDIKCWGIRENDVIHMNRPYLCRVDKDNYGYSIRSFKEQIRLLS